MDLTNFEALLNEQYNWPATYSFKFVVKSEQTEDLLDHLEDHRIEMKKSAKGTYTSITSHKKMTSSQEVIEVYRKVKTVRGILSL